MNNLHADDLILFAHVVRAGSFTHASERTGIPKATLSRRLSALETALGERLMQRSTRSLALTEFGEQMMDHALRLLNENEDAVAAAQHEHTAPRGILRVSLPPEYRELLVTQLVMQFTRRYPDVQLELDLSVRRVDLATERFDVAVRAATHLPDDSTMVARHIATLRSGLFASRGYLRQNTPPREPADLLRHMGLMLTPSTNRHQPWQLSSGGLHWQGTPQRMLAANSLGLLQTLAAQGLGIVGLSEHFADELLRRGELERVLPQWSLPSVNVWCITLGRRLLSRSTIAFIDVLKSVLTDGTRQSS